MHAHLGLISLLISRLGESLFMILTYFFVSVRSTLWPRSQCNVAIIQMVPPLHCSPLRTRKGHRSTLIFKIHYFNKFMLLMLVIEPRRMHAVMVHQHGSKHTSLCSKRRGCLLDKGDKLEYTWHLCSSLSLEINGRRAICSICWEQSTG